MGCGASAAESTASKPADGPEAKQTDATPVEPWATRVAGSSDGVDQFATSPKSEPRSKDEPVLLDADDDTDEIEVICEGNVKQAAIPTPKAMTFAANGQEAPEAVESSASSKPAPAKPIIPKAQQEEAAKLAEQRKRFDNQRYAHSNNASLGVGSGGPPVAATAAPRHDLVMGLNLSEAQGRGEPKVSYDSLPGGIEVDTPREERMQPKTVKNNHDMFDDEDEMLMKEILDSAD